MFKYIKITTNLVIFLQIFTLFNINISKAEEVRDITFPIEEGWDYNFSDTYGAARSGGRSHIGTDIMVDQMTPLVSAVDGRVTYIVEHDEGWGLALYIQDNEGYSYRYLHINNDTPGTDDGKEIRSYAFPKNIYRGARVTAGQVVAYAGDSGNAEYTGHHLHFEIWTPSREPINSYPSLMAAIDDSYTLPSENNNQQSNTQTVATYQFTRDLKLGSTGQDVYELQKYLNLAGFTVAVSGVGSRGNETTYFGPATEAALIKYQQAQNISPASGYFGPVTRESINSSVDVGSPSSENNNGVEIYANIQAGWLVKDRVNPKVYYVDDLLQLRWLVSEEAATRRFGSDWTTKIKVINDLSIYTEGRALN